MTWMHKQGMAFYAALYVPHTKYKQLYTAEKLKNVGYTYMTLT